MKNPWQRLGLALVGVVAWGGAAAQDAPVPQLEPSAAVGCLVATDPKLPEPAYPFPQYKTDTPGRVLLEMHFSAPDRRPAVKVLESEGDALFVESARAYAATLRVPCLGAGADGVRVAQEYIFRTDQRRVYLAAPNDADHARRAELLACLKNESGSAHPAYPSRALRDDVQGRVLADMKFTGPDKPPEVTLHRRNSARSLASSVEAWVERYRMPCFVPGRDEPVRLTNVFVFLLQSSHQPHPDGYGFKAITLPQLLPLVKGIREQALRLDTRGMGCPFELRLTYRRPAMDNTVGSLGDYDAAREPLMKWLRGVELNLPARTLDAVYGDTADITVPCVNIDIDPKPKEKT